jgi:hypothetical protein
MSEDDMTDHERGLYLRSILIAAGITLLLWGLIILIFALIL